MITLTSTNRSFSPAGLFKPLDDFLRTSSVGEFFSRLLMIRAFAAHLRAVSSAQALANVLEGLWQYYAQVCCVAALTFSCNIFCELLIV